MASTDTKEAALPPPPEPAAPVIAPADRAKEAVAIAGGAGKKKTDFLRPLRYIKGFVGGTITESLDGTATWGRRGMWAGMAAMAAFAIATGGISVIGMGMLGALGGLAVGAGVGGGVGLLTGGMHGLNRQRRAVKYADDLLERDETKKSNASVSGVDYRAAWREEQKKKNYQFDRGLQQQRELKEDVSTYWQDREAARSGGFGHGRGGL